MNLSKLRQRLWQSYRALGRTLQTLTAPAPMTRGSFYLMHRKCGKPSCRCAHGPLHPAWVLTRSEEGRHKLYTVPAAERARVRQLTGAYRRHQRARTRFVNHSAALLVLADQVAQAQMVPWPAPRTSTPAR
jgi:hypothetical protein